MGLTTGEKVEAIDYNILKNAVQREVQDRRGQNITIQVSVDKEELSLASQINNVIDDLNLINSTITNYSTVTANQNLIRAINSLETALLDFQSRPKIGTNSGCASGCVGLCQGCDDQCTGVCGTDCVNGCTDACTSCTGVCGGSCNTGCLGSCQGSCKTGCSGGCKSSCVNNCNVGCAESCTWNCTGSSAKEGKP